MKFDTHGILYAYRYAREDGRNGFAEAEFGWEFREAAFRLHGLQPPEGILPRSITLLSAVQGEEVRSCMLLCFALCPNACSQCLHPA